MQGEGGIYESQMIKFFSYSINNVVKLITKIAIKLTNFL